MPIQEVESPGNWFVVRLAGVRTNEECDLLESASEVDRSHDQNYSRRGVGVVEVSK